MNNIEKEEKKFTNLWELLFGETVYETLGKYPELFDVSKIKIVKKGKEL